MFPLAETIQLCLLVAQGNDGYKELGKDDDLVMHLGVECSE